MDEKGRQGLQTQQTRGQFRAARDEYAILVVVYEILSVGIAIVTDDPVRVSLRGLALGVFLLMPTAMRLRDTGHSAWWSLGLFVPVVSLCVALHCLAYPAKERRNERGQNGKIGFIMVTWIVVLLVVREVTFLLLLEVPLGKYLL